MDSEIVLKASCLKGEYACVRKPEEYIEAVSNVSVEMERNKVFGIAGESGCGKSTLLKMLYGYIKWPLTLTQGALEFSVENTKINIYSLSFEERKKRIWWKYMSLIPQNAMNVLNPTMRIRDHFTETFKIHMGMSREESYTQAHEYCRSMKLPKDVLSAFPHQLSGGMTQRVVIALAVSQEPELILADEPSSALDVVTQRAVLTLLLKIQKKLNNTLVVVSHDLNVHAVMTDKIAVMYAGKIVEIGETEEIFAKPLHPYTKALIDALPAFGSKIRKTGLEGQPPDLKDHPLGCRFSERCPHPMEKCRLEEPPMFKRHAHCVACWLCMKD